MALLTSQQVNTRPPWHPLWQSEFLMAATHQKPQSEAAKPSAAADQPAHDQPTSRIFAGEIIRGQWSQSSVETYEVGDFAIIVTEP